MMFAAMVFCRVIFWQFWKEEMDQRGKADGCRFQDAGFSAIPMSPVQKDMTPIIVMQRVTASLEESKAAVVMSGILPEKAAKMDANKNHSRPQVVEHFFLLS